MADINEVREAVPQPNPEKVSENRDPDEFRKAVKKVESSTESEKRDRKKKQRAQEEDEAEFETVKAKGEADEAPETSMQEFLGGGEHHENVLEGQEGQRAAIQFSEDEETAPLLKSEYEPEIPTERPDEYYSTGDMNYGETQAEQQHSAPHVEKEGGAGEEPDTKSTDRTEGKKTEGTKKKREKKEVKDTSLLASKGEKKVSLKQKMFRKKMEQKKAQKSLATPQKPQTREEARHEHGAKTEHAEHKTPKEAQETDKVAQAQTTSAQKQQPQAPTKKQQKGTALDKEGDFGIEAGEAKSGSDGDSGSGKQGGDQKQSKKGSPFASLGEVPMMPGAAGVAGEMGETEMVSYVKLSPKIFALFEKLSGIITVNRADGKTNTKITLDMKGSVFDGCELHITEYDEGKRLDIQLQGSPEAMSLFNENAADLAAAFKQGQYSFEVNVKQAELSQKKQMFKRKGKTGGGGNQAA